MVARKDIKLGYGPTTLKPNTGTKTKEEVRERFSFSFDPG
jgi:hypothetical protein